MLSRPLNLSDKLAQPPRDWDWVFYVDAGLLVLFFVLFGSRFVLSPGLGTDFRLPVSPVATAGAASTTHVISVQRGGIIFADPGGNLDLPKLRDWLRAAARQTSEPRLLVRASVDVSLGDLTAIRTAAEEAGFVGIVWGAEDDRTGPAVPRSE